MELQFGISQRNKEGQNISSAPSEPDIEIRTMKSDIKAIKESGGDLVNVAAEEIVSKSVISDQPIFTSSQTAGGRNLPVVKMVIIIITVLILAIIVGFASYYLASEVFK